MLHIPSVKTMVNAPAGLVTRTRLLDLLDRAPEPAVVLVCAPPGYGKSYLLADWFVHRVPSTTAWLALDEDDNDFEQIDVVGRYFFSMPVTGGFEMTEILLASLIFAGLPLVTLRDDRVGDGPFNRQVRIVKENPALRRAIVRIVDLVDHICRVIAEDAEAMGETGRNP